VVCAARLGSGERERGWWGSERERFAERDSPGTKKKKKKKENIRAKMQPIGTLNLKPEPVKASKQATHAHFSALPRLVVLSAPFLSANTQV
jgi:hypothetical protein